MQSQGSYRVVEFIDNMQGLDVHGFLEIAKELFDAGEIRTWHKRTDDEIIVLAFDPHLANLPLLDIHQIDNLLGMFLHV
ncbi:MAG: hypothetical protein V3U27_11310 [Candidatus Tectomicrobia bacterium]